MEKLAGKVAVVTGASAGIGKSIAERLASHGMQVVACARNVDALHQLAESVNVKGAGKVFPLKCDVTKEMDVASLFNFVRKTFGTLHACVNNAGIALNAPLLSGDTKDWQSMLDVNVLGLSMCVREGYKVMKAANVDDGVFININSMAGHRVHPLVPFYCATKFAVTALTEGLRRELRAANSHIKCCSISPGAVETDFAYKTMKDNPEMVKQVYSSMKCLQADDITDAVIFVLSAPARMDVNDILIQPTDKKD